MAFDISNFDLAGARNSGATDDQIKAFLIDKGADPDAVNRLIQPEISTITGTPIPTGGEKIDASKQLLASGIRYAPPIAATVLTKGKAPFLDAAVAALSEAGARGIESEADTVKERVQDMLYGGGAAGAFDLAATGTFKGLGWGIGKVSDKVIKPLAKKALLPKEMDPLTEITQRTLRGFTPEPGEKPYTLTLGRLNAEERNFINWLESLPRAAIWGGGKMRAADLRNVDRITKAIDDYISKRADEMDATGFSVFLKRTLGDLSNPGEAFHPVEAYRKALYKKFDDIVAANPEAAIDLSPLLDYFMKRSKDPRVREMLQAGTGLDVLPQVAVRQDAGVIDLDLVGDELIPSAAITDEAKALWSQVPLNDADQFLKLINKRFKRAERMGDEAEKNILRHIRGKIEPQFKKQLETLPEAKEYYEAAQSFFGAKERVLYNNTIKSLRRALKEKPSTVLNLFIGNSARADRLKSLKDALFFSAAVSGGKDAAEEMWEKSILRPLRYNIISSAVDQTTGVFNPKTFIAQMDKLSAHDKNYINEVFGSETQVKRIRDLAVSLMTAQSKYRDSVLMQLTQAGGIASTAGGMATAFADTPEVRKAGAGGLLAGATLLVGPRLLAQVFANPTSVNMLTEGVKAGPKSAAFGRAVRKLMTQHAASETDYDGMSADEFVYYHTVPEQ